MRINRETPESNERQRALGEALSTTARYLPLTAALIALGLLIIDLLSRYELLGSQAWQIEAVAGATVAMGLLQLLVSGLVARGRTSPAFGVFAALLGFWALSIVLLWESAWPVAIVIVWMPVLTAMAAAMPRERAAAWAIGAVAVSFVVLWLDANPIVERASTGNPAVLASLLLLSSAVVLYVVGALVLRLFSYRSVQGRLVTALVLIMAVPVLTITAITALNAFTNSEEQFRNSLQAISSLRAGQLKSTVDEIKVQLAPLQQGSDEATNILHVIDTSGQDDVAYRLNLSIASTVLRNLITQHPAIQYEEVFVMDLRGNVLLSTYKLDEGTNFASEEFFRQGATGFYASMTRFTGLQNTTQAYKLVAAAPVFGNSAADVRGMIVAVVNGDAIFSALSTAPGLEQAGIYLVNNRNEVVSPSSTDPVIVNAWPIVHAVLGRLSGIAGSYSNYREENTFGYVSWEPSINSALVVEVPTAAVYNRALASLLVSVLIGIFSIIIAAITALSTSSTISDPISRLASVARTLATGDLSARATGHQPDEVGNLAESFNAMAEQLQSIVGNLEERVAERTEALEQQSLRLRTAAEVARDAASAPDLDTLLDQAARLIVERFGFYHAGIFLLDDRKQYAVLRASPSEAGKLMLERRHKLRVGEQGIVGRVAATGEPRIALDTGVDAIYFSNPLLPNTHSEMALPLKTSEGTIGVIDIQSDQREAFTQEDIAVVQVMADQLATAIQRTNLLQQVQAQLGQLETSYQGFTEQAWRTFSQMGRPHIGYRYDNVRMDAVHATPDTARLAAGTADQPTDASNGQETLQVPIRLRGQVIGAVDLRFQSSGLPETTAMMIQQIADRLATALENARLLEESTRRANKERAIGEITAKISSSVNMRNVLQTAVEELGRAIPGSEVMIQFRPDTEL